MPFFFLISTSAFTLWSSPIENLFRTSPIMSFLFFWRVYFAIWSCPFPFLKIFVKNELDIGFCGMESLSVYSLFLLGAQFYDGIFRAILLCFIEVLYLFFWYISLDLFQRKFLIYIMDQIDESWSYIPSNHDTFCVFLFPNSLQPFLILLSIQKFQIVK